MGDIRDRFKKLAKFRSMVIICLRVKQTTEVDISTREDCRFLGVYCHHIRKPLRISRWMYMAYPSRIIHSNPTCKNYLPSSEWFGNIPTEESLYMGELKTTNPATNTILRFL